MKMVPANAETRSTKSLSTKGSSSSSTSDMGKMFSTINKTFKTMGKAMSQASEEIQPLAMKIALELSTMLW